MAKIERPADLIDVLAYDDETRIFYAGDHSLVFGWVCRGLPGGDDRVEQRLRALLVDGWPDNALLQISLVSSPNLFHEFEEIRALRSGADNSVLREMTEARIGFLSQRVDSAFGGQSGLVLRRFDVYFVAKVPARTAPVMREELEEVAKLQWRVAFGLKAIGLQPVEMDHHEFVVHMGALVNRSASGSWRVLGGDTARHDQLLSEQVFDPGTDVRIDRGGLWLDDVRVTVLSPKALPREMPFGLAARYYCDPVTGSQGVRSPFMVTLNVFFPEQTGARSKLAAKRNYVMAQATGPLARWLPQVAKRAGDLDGLLGSLEGGHRLVKGWLSLSLFSSASGMSGSFDERCKDALRKAEEDGVAAINFFATSMIVLMVDKFIPLPAFLNAMPFGASREAMRDLGRYRTMTTQHAGRLAPIFTDWEGTGTGSLTLVSRNGALVQVCLFDSSTNYNATIAAESGSGKSFLANEMIVNYLSQGATVWVIDVGGSYANLCELLGGSYVDVGDDGICFNPFPLIRDYEEEGDVLEAVIAAMASPTEMLTDLQRAQLARTMREIYDAKGTAMTVDDIAARLKQSEDERVRDVGIRLYAFTTEGQYGRFFTGPNTVSFSGAFSVLELENLRSRKHLQRVVLLMLIYAIQQEMSVGDRARKKLVFIDEAWDLLTDGEVGRFIETGYRRFRKSNGAAITITQSMRDFYSSQVGLAIVQNSATMFLLGQKPETIAQLRADGKLELGDFGVEVLRSVHTVPGAYSEIYVRTDRGEGVGRLMVDQYTQMVYSTRPSDRAAIAAYRERGLSVSEAIKSVLRDRKVAASLRTAAV